jgi:integrase
MDGGSDGTRTRGLCRDRARHYHFPLLTHHVQTLTFPCNTKHKTLTLRAVVRLFFTLTYLHLLTWCLHGGQSMRISKRIVDAARASEKPVFIWDDTLPGFALLTLPSGAKSFVFQYRTAEGRTRRATVAKVGTVTPDQARALADEMSRKVKGGGDPLEDKRKAREALTVAQLLDAYLASAKFAEKAQSTQLTDTGRIERHLRTLLGSRHVSKLPSEDIRRAFAAIRDGKTAATIKTGAHGLARVVGGEGTARKAIRLLRAIFAWGIAERMIDGNPADGVATGTDGEREAVLEPQDYARLFATLADMETKRGLRPAVADAIRIIAMTGARRGEIVGLRWYMVNLKRGLLILPVRAHKTGRKTGKPRTISLPSAAQDIIARQPQGGPDDFVFTPSKGAGPVSLKAWRKIRVEAKLPEGIGLHGLRHSLATLLAIGGAEAPQIMASLGHRQLSTTQRYLHFADKARAVLAERAAAPALAGMAAAAGAPAADVVLLGRKGRT